MSLLMPEYERQLRAAARRLASDSRAAPKRSREGLGSWLLLGVTGAVTVAIAAAALVLVGHRGSPSGAPAAGLPPTQYDCAANQILRTKGRLVPTAHGTVAGRRWTLEVDSGRHGIRSVQAGRLILGGRAYGFCETRLNVGLVNAGRHGIVYGLASRFYHPPIVIEAMTAHRTPRKLVPAPEYPARTRQVSQATLFLRALPATACAYHFLAMTAPVRSTRSAVGESVDVFYTFTRSCAPGQLRHSS